MFGSHKFEVEFSPSEGERGLEFIWLTSLFQCQFGDEHEKS
jgi:hypothetical protein